MRYPLVNDGLALLWMIEFGCIDLHVWTSRADLPERPDIVLFDLDPAGVPFADVARVMGKSVGACQMLLLRAGKLLRESLEHVDEATYLNIFAVGLREVQELGSLSDTPAGVQASPVRRTMSRASSFVRRSSRSKPCSAPTTKFEQKRW